MKKGLSLLITVVMLLTMVTVNASATSFADTEGKSCETAVEVLSALGIVEGKAEGSYEPDSSLTRAEMATIILRAMNMAQNAKGTDVFTDVPSSHWAYANVSAAYQLGIVNGTSATTFAPDATVTYEQAVKMVVSALGYGVQAEAIGGYPSGYLAKATQLDLLKGVKVGGEMSRGDMAILLYNALDVELYLQTTFGPEAYEFDANQTATLLSYYLKVSHYTSQITATPMAQINPPSRTLLTDEVAVGAKVLKKGQTNAQDLLGMRSDIYTREIEDTDIEEIVAIIPKANTEVLELNAKDIEPSSTTSQLIYLDENDKEIKESIVGATLVFNGRVKGGWTAADFQPESGKARFIANGEGGYDLIIVESYKNFVVDTVLAEDNEIYFMEADANGVNSMILDLSDSKTPTVFTDEANMPLTLDDLARWDILSVAESLDGSVRRIYRSYKMVSGTITEMSDDEVVIDGTAYAVSDYLQNSEKFDIELGQSAAYYLDYTGAIVAVDTNYDASYSYGWIMGAELTKGLDSKARFRFFTQDGEFVVFDTTEKITFVEAGRERSVNAADILGDTPNTVWDGENPIPQLIRYETNEEGLLIKLESAANKTALNLEDEEKLGGEFSMDWYMGTSRRSREFDGTKAGSAASLPSNVRDSHSEFDGQFFTKIFRTENTKYFIIPADPTIEEDYIIQPASAITLEGYRDMECLCLFDVNENYQVQALVLRNDMSNAASAGKNYPDYTVPAALITGISIGMTEDGDVSRIIKAVNQNGQEISLAVEDDFECLYKVANADLDKDPAWYVWNSERTKKLYKTDGEDWKKDGKRRELFMSANDLQTGDIIQYKADSLSNLTLASVIHRLAYTGNKEFTQGTGTINYTTPTLKYRGGNLSLLGTVIKKLENGIFVKVNLIGDTTAVPNGSTAVRALPSVGKFILWDADKETYRAITAADVVQGDYIYSHWWTTSQKLVVVYRGQKVDKILESITAGQ